MFVRMDVKSLDIYRGLGPTLDIYHGFRKRLIFTLVFENVRYLQCFSKAPDIYYITNHIRSRFTMENETYMEKRSPQKLLHGKGFCMLDPCLLDIYRKHP